MQEKKKWKIIEFSLVGILFLFMLIIGLVMKETEDDTIPGIIMVVFFVLMVPVAFYVESKQKKINEAYKQENEIENKKEFLEITSNKKTESIYFDLMNQIVSGECDKINEVLFNTDIEISFDYDEEENYYETSFDCYIKKTKSFCCTALFYHEGKFYLVLNDFEEEKELVDETKEEVIDIIVSDLKNFIINN